MRSRITAAASPSSRCLAAAASPWPLVLLRWRLVLPWRLLLWWRRLPRDSSEDDEMRRGCSGVDSDEDGGPGGGDGRRG